MKIGSWNAAALLAAVRSRSTKAAPRFARFLKLAKQLTIVCTQETHGHIADINELRRELRHFEIGHSLFPDSAATGGVITCIQPAFAKLFTSITHSFVIEGRILKSFLSGPLGNLCIINAHMPNTNELTSIYSNALRDILRVLPNPAECFTVLIGDWNFALSSDGRLKADGSGWSAGDDNHTSLFHRLCSSWIEFYQCEDTRREVRDGLTTHTARLGRAYSTLTSALVSDLTIVSESLGPLKVDMVSDHVPIVVTISTFKPQDAPKRLAPWISRHPLFSDLLDGALRALPAGASIPWYTTTPSYAAYRIAASGVEWSGVEWSA